ncbi:MAG TPA: radical SAM protein [Candidatus Hydrogenedentes bacterium]|nr:radical SAM protein [Candidatus Hydrogenedentota bacterium]
MNSQQAGMPTALQAAAVIRETTCRTVLNRSTVSDYSLNCYTGCAHGCVYCYARFMQRFHPHAESWGGFVDVKVNAVEALERQLRRARPGNVFMSSACDGWQPVEGDRRLTRTCAALLLEHEFRVNVLTKSPLVLRDLDVFAGRNATIGATVTTLDEALRKLWEPRAGSVEERSRIIKEAHAAGLETSVMFGPLLPFLSDDQNSVNALFEWAADLDVDVIWVDGLNPRPKVWESVRDLLDRQFPGLGERYRRVLFSAPVRTAYLRGLRERVAVAAQKAHMADRLAGCP